VGSAAILPGYTVIMTLEQPCSDVYRIPLPTPYPVGPVNCYVLDGPCPTLVDCGPPTEEAAHALRTGLSALGLTPADLEAIVLTHHHIDHAGGLSWLLKESTAKILGHPYNERWLVAGDEALARHRAFVDWLLRYCGLEPAAAGIVFERLASSVWSADLARVDQHLIEGDTVFLGAADWRVLHTPGHAGTSITLVRADGAAIVGDTLLERISSNALAEPAYEGTAMRSRSLIAYRQSLRRLAELELMVLMPGHGACFREHREVIDRRLLNQEERAGRLLATLSKDRETVGVLARALFPGLTDLQQYLALSEVLAHLDLLQEQDRVTVEGDSPARYRVSGAKPVEPRGN
jgi:glyoxylase-like metal-dependent hydrolase (beta-lactamase superfamily II)